MHVEITCRLRNRDTPLAYAPNRLDLELTTETLPCYKLSSGFTIAPELGVSETGSSSVEIRVVGDVPSDIAADG